ncbi:uncharacterized protein [Haliotis asinina]|uniref:uncharacterized protein n=1 Tax=Haliotis asinina TaxID=109174 RepID=UPI003531A7E3
MDFNLLLAELRNAAQQYCQKISDKYAATVAYCETACKTIDKLENVEEYENKVIGLWIILGYIGEMYSRLTTGPVTNALCQKLFRHCARTVLNIQWQQLPDDSQSKQNFHTTLETFHTKLSSHNYTRFSLIHDLIETGWTHPTLGLVMAEEDDNEEEECLNYIKQEDPVILKIRVEIMIQENCEEFALNLCSWCLKHPALTDDLDIRQTQLMLLHKLNQQDRLQEECQKIPCHDGVRLITRLQQTENNKALCTELAQTFLIQDWIRPSDHCSSKELLTLWIRHQYLADSDQDKFLSSVWAVAKLSRSTEQIGLIIDGVREECGNMFLQLYTDLCIFAINYDKSCLEKHMQEGDMDGLRERQQAMAATCEKLSLLYATRNPKTAMYAAVTAFALNPNQATLAAVKSFYVNQSLSLVKDRGKVCCSNCTNKTGECDHPTKSGKINPATFFEVERLLNMLRPYYLNPDHDWLSLGPACDKYLAEREAVTQNYSNEDLINDSSSVSEGSITELDQSGMSPHSSQRTLLHQHLVRPISSSMPGYTEQITQVSKHLKPFTVVSAGKGQSQDVTSSSIASIEPTLQLSDAELGDKHTLIRQLLFATEDLSLADLPDAHTLNELLQQGNIDLMPEAFQEITIDNNGSGGEEISVPVPGHMKNTAPVSAADPLFSSLNIPEQEVPTNNAGPVTQHSQSTGHPVQQLQLLQQQQLLSKIETLKNSKPQSLNKGAMKLVSASATSSQSFQSTSSTQARSGHLYTKHMAVNSGAVKPPSAAKSSVGSAVFHITSGLLRVPSQLPTSQLPVPTHQEQAVILQDQSRATSLPAGQVAVAYSGGQVTTQTLPQPQYYTNLAQTVQQQVVQQQHVPVAINLIGTSAVSHSVSAPVQQASQMSVNLGVQPTSTVAQIAPSIAAQLAQPQLVQSQVPVAVVNQQLGQTTMSTTSSQGRPQGVQRQQQQQHQGKPQLAGVNQHRVLKTDHTKASSVITANLQQMLKLSSKTVTSTEQKSVPVDNAIYTSTNHPHVALKSKSPVFPIVKKKSEITGKAVVPDAAPPSAVGDSNVPFVLKSSLTKPKPKPKSKATIFTNSMMTSKVTTNTALLGGCGKESLTCVKPLLSSGSTVSKPGTLPKVVSSPNAADSSVGPVTAQGAISAETRPCPMDGNQSISSSCSSAVSTPVEDVVATVSSTDKPKKASKKLFNVFYRCKICQEQLLSLDDLRKHIQSICRAEEFAPVDANGETSDLSVKSGHLNPKLTIKSLEACRVYQCPVCKIFCVTDPEVLDHRTRCLKSRCRPRKKCEKPPSTEVLPGPPHSAVEGNGGQNTLTVLDSGPPLPPEPPIDLAALDLTNTDDLKKFIEHFKRQEMMKEKTQAPPSKPKNKTKKVEIPKAVVSVMSGVVDKLEAATEVTFTTASMSVTSTTQSSATVTSATQPPEAAIAATISQAGQTQLSVMETKSEASKPKPKQTKPKKIPNPKFKELCHNGNTFFKCFLCKQTFCRMESLVTHWPECYNLNGPIRKPKKASDQKLPTSTPQTPGMLPVVSDTGLAAARTHEMPAVAEGGANCPNTGLSNQAEDEASASPTANTKEISKNISGMPSKSPNNSNKSSPSKPKPPPVPIDGKELAKYEDIIQSVIDSGAQKKKKKVKAAIPAGEGNNEEAEGASAPKKKKSKKSERIPSNDVFETVPELTGEKSSPKKRNKPIPKKKHVNVKQMLKDRLECLLSGKKDRCDVRSDGKSVPLSPRTKGRPKPQILSETRQVIIIVGLEWGCGCAPCGTLFRNHRNLIQHLVIKHLQPYSTRKGESGATVCHLCQQLFPAFISYLNHTPQHSEIILERMDALIEEKGDVDEVEKSPEKEESEENYVPFPDIQEALNDMLKIRQQQTQGDDVLKLRPENVSDVHLLSPCAAAGDPQTALPTSMSLDSLHEFLPDPSKENVDELAAFARMINDPAPHSDITSGISEQTSFKPVAPVISSTVCQEQSTSLEVRESNVVTPGFAEHAINETPLPVEPSALFQEHDSDASVTQKENMEGDFICEKSTVAVPQTPNQRPQTEAEVLTSVDSVEAKPHDQVTDVELENVVEKKSFPEECQETVAQEVCHTDTESKQCPPPSFVKASVASEDKDLGMSRPGDDVTDDTSFLRDQQLKVDQDRASFEHLKSHPRNTELLTSSKSHILSSVVTEESEGSHCKLHLTEDESKYPSEGSDLQEEKDQPHMSDVPETTSELKAIVKHLRSHPRKADFIGQDELDSKKATKAESISSPPEVKDAPTAVFSNDHDPDVQDFEEYVEAGMQPKRNLRKSMNRISDPEIAQKGTTSEGRATKKDRVSTRRDKMKGDESRVERRGLNQPDRVYRLRKTIPAKQFYKGSMKMKPRASRSSILDVLHSSKKLAVMKTQSRQAVGRINRPSVTRKEENKVLIKRTPERPHSAKFVTRSLARQIVVHSNENQPRTAPASESAKPDHNMSRRTRGTLKKNEFGLKSFEVRLNNLSAETVRRKSAELLHAPADPLPRRASCDEVTTSPLSTRRGSCDNPKSPPTSKQNPTSPSFLDSFLSYLNTRTDDDDPFKKKKLIKKHMRPEQKNEACSPIDETEDRTETKVEADSASEDCKEELEESLHLSLAPGDHPSHGKLDDDASYDPHLKLSEVEIRPSVTLVTCTDNCQEIQKETVEDCTSYTKHLTKDDPSVDSTPMEASSEGGMADSADMEEDEVILLEEFGSSGSNTSQDDKPPAANEQHDVAVIPAVVCCDQKTGNGKNDSCETVADKQTPDNADKQTCDATDVHLATVNKTSSDSVGAANPHADSKQNGEVNNQGESTNSVTIPIASDVATDSDSPQKEDKLKGVKSLREKVKTEPFTWDVDDEEDQKLAERNQRSLKAFRQQVSIAPFTWDLDEEERAHVITDIEQVQIAPVSSCSVTRNTRSRRSMKLSSDSRDSRGSSDSDKKEATIECEATLTTVTWNVEVDEDCGDNTEAVVDNMDSINCIRVSSVVAGNSCKRKLTDTDSQETNAKRPVVTISSGESSPSVESVEFVSDTLPVEEGGSKTSVMVVPAQDVDSNDSYKASRKSDPKPAIDKAVRVVSLSKENLNRKVTRGSAILTRKAAKSKALSVDQPASKKSRTSSTPVSNHMPAMVRRSAKNIGYSSRNRQASSKTNPPPRVQVIRVDPILEGVTTRRSRHGSSERTVHTPVASDQIQQPAATGNDHKWTINKRKNFAYQFSRTRRDRKQH